MILPDKNIKLEYSLLNCGALILDEIREPKTISLLWEQVKQKETLDNYEKFVLTLDFLFIINAIKLNDGFLERCKNDSFC
ncbi:ABC-three component system middle component 6 [uncultured Holdemanella sp.]|uniref:ABC-three component system middle component 6 n=1 Tax=uncultured Holdemanella sp. TaxID=1763549 RepID=UPI002582B3D4|nr:ABC-three component system middle component 6 [uncultured Holdemanella sp.]